MASALVDLVKINITSTGTGPLTLGNAAQGYRGREALTNGRDYSYSIQQGANWEVGRGTFLSATNRLVRSVLYSSNGGEAISLKGGAQVAFTALSEDLDSVQLTADALAAAIQTAEDAAQVAIDRGSVEAGVATVNAAVGLVVGGQSVYPNAYASTLPKGVTSGTIGGTAITGATVGTYALTPTGGSITGVQANLVVLTATTARIDIVNTGLGTGTTPPTWANPAGATLPVGTTLTAVVATLVADQKSYWAASADGLQILQYGNNAGLVATYPFGGTQTVLYAKAGVDAALAPIIGSIVKTAGNYLNIINNIDQSIVARVNLLTGEIEAVTGKFGGQQIAGDPAITGLGVRAADGSYPVVLGGANGVSKFMQVEADKTVTQTAFAKTRFSHLTDRVSGNFGAVLNLVIWHGQSWSLGFDSLPVVTGVPLFPGKALMLSGGVMQQDTTAISTATLTNAYEFARTGTVDFPAAVLGETGAVAFANRVLQLVQAENNIAPTDQDFRIVVAAPGEGSKSIEQLSGEPYVSRWKAIIDRCYALAQAEGVTLRVAGICWEQGQGSSDDPVIPGTATTEYPQELENIRAAIETYAKSVVGGHGTVPLFTWQVNPQQNESTTDDSNSARGVGFRFWRGIYGVNSSTGALARTFPNIYTAGASYQIQRVNSSNIHMLPPAARRMAQDFALAFKRVVIDGGDWVPLAMTNWTRQGKVGLIYTTHLPRYGARGSLVLDQSFGAAAAAVSDTGIHLYDSSGTQLSLSVLPYVGPGGTIIFKAAADIPAGATVGIADQGTDYTYTGMWRSNFRNSAGEYPFSNNQYVLADRIACAN